jgi:hypothetical protein
LFENPFESKPHDVEALYALLYPPIGYKKEARVLIPGRWGIGV